MNFLTSLCGRCAACALVVCLLILLGTLEARSTCAAEPEFPAPFDTQKVDGNPLTDAQQSLQSFTLPAGFRAQLFASEPMVQQPIAITLDPRGRLWVAENYTYAESAVNFDSSLRDRIVILEDTDRDGQADKRTVFWDQAEKLTSIEVGYGGVWALAAPHLLFIPDRDGDDQPDSEPEVLLDGWDSEDVRHNIVNGLRWGPDGWLYGRHGILATSQVGAPGTPPNQRTPINCGIWRYHPTRHVFEAVAHGTTNPWGTDWDEYGQMFFINTVIGHLWHVLPGAHFERMYGEDLRPNLYDLLPQTADHVHWDTAEKWSDIRQGVSDTTDRAGGGHAHSGLMIYLGDNWPADVRGDVFAINLHGRRLNRDRLQRQGASYTATHAPDYLAIQDAWFRGIDLMYGPDGGVYIADWTDIGECHENDGVHRTSGRIFKVTYGNAALQRPANLAALDARQLAELQLHRNDWIVRTARRILAERAAAGEDVSAARQPLLAMFGEQDEVTRKLRAMWALYGIGAVDQSWLIQQLQHPEEHVRVWAVALLGDAGPLDATTSAALCSLAREESSGLVLAWLASALQRLPAEARWSLGEILLSKSDWADDPVYPRMVWYGLEPAVVAEPQRVAHAFASARLPLARVNMARRLTQQLVNQPDAVDLLVAELPQLDQASQRDALRGMALALRGWRKAKAPPSWKQVSETLARSDAAELRDLTREIAVVFGDGRAAQQLLVMLQDESAELDIRRSALRSLVESRNQEVVPLLSGLLSNRELARDAVYGLAAFSAAATPETLIERYGALPAQARSETINTLVSRPAYAQALMQAVASDKIPRTDVSAFQIRQMRGYGNARLAEQLDQLWPELRDITTAKAEKIEQARSMLPAERIATADKVHGRQLFERSCASCHTLFGSGGKVGPDLTGGQRSNLQYLLENIIDPSAQVAENFRMSILVLVDGRVLNGVIAERTAQTLSVQTATEKIVLPVEDIEEIQPSQLSMMPDQLLDPLAAQDVADLIAYLMSPAQVLLPEEAAGQ